MKTKHFYYLAVLLMFFTACKDSDEYTGVTKEIFRGYAQKGPFINGSSITISELKPNLDQSGRTYFTTIANNSGSFELKNLELNSHYANLKVDGYYFNEISGKTSAGQITLYALVDVRDVNSANVNVLTHLEKSRVEYLVKQEKKNFSDAKKQAQREVLAIFGFESSETSSETLDLTDNAALLAISCILQSYLSTGDMMELMANISADIEMDGVLDNTTLGSKLINNAYAVSLSIENVRNNLTTKYTELSNDVIIPDFESYIQSFLDSGLYPQTLFITYPATGIFGDNILSETVTSVTGDQKYSMKADVPEGMSLKIVVKSDFSYYGSGHLTPLNWMPSESSTNQCQEYTVMESGKPNELLVGFWYAGYATIEYYENSSTIPTKIKQLHIKN